METDMINFSTEHPPGAGRAGPRSAWATAALVLVIAGLLLFAAGGASAAAIAVPLGTADSFAVLAGAGITNTGPTTISGDMGTFPTTTISGGASITQTGTNHGGDAVTQGAKADLITAYNTAAGEGPTSPIGPGSPIVDLGGHTLGAGVYNSGSTIGLTGVLILDGGGDPNAVFVFQAGSALTTASASSVSLINGAQSCNVFWQITSDATLGTGSTFRGTLIALNAITVTTAVTVDGRVLARNGAVTLDTDTIARSACAVPVPTPTPTPTPTPAAAAADTAAAAAAAAQAAAAQAAAALVAASKATYEANAAAAAKAAEVAAVAAKKAEAAAATAARLAARTKLAAVQAAAAKARVAAANAKVAAAKAAALAKLARQKAAASTKPHATVAHASFAFTG
jgi:hypothetical protein